MMHNDPVISIIIPTLKEGPFIERTLKQFENLSIPHELIVTDGGSTDETLDIARRYTDKIVVWSHPRRQTFGEAKNSGAALAVGRYLVFIDADVLIPDPQRFFEEMLSVFDKKPRLVAMTVPLKPWVGNPLIDSVFCAPLNWFYVIANNIFHSGNASGEFQMIRRGIFRSIGGYSEHLAAGEDNEVFRHLAEHGRTLSYWRLAVRHSCRRPHKLGWLRTYTVWIENGLSVAVRKKAIYKEWPVIR